MRTVISIIIKTLLYSSPVWLLCIYMEFRLAKMENSYSYKMNCFKDIERTCEVLILGNSEMLKGVNPEYLPIKAFNMAHVSQSLTVDAQFLKKYLTHITNLKTVILGVSYLSFGEELQQSEEAWRLAFYRRHYALYFNKPRAITDYSAILRYTPYESLKLLFHNFKSDYIQGMQPNGWMKTIGCESKDTSELHALKQAEKHNKGLRESNVKQNVEALQNMLQLLKERNINVILLHPLVMPAYEAALDKKWVAKNDSILNQFKVAYAFQTINYSDSTNFYNVSGFFNDVNHLNEAGARQLTITLANFVNRN